MVMIKPRATIVNGATEVVGNANRSVILQTAENDRILPTVQSIWPRLVADYESLADGLGEELLR